MKTLFLFLLSFSTLTISAFASTAVNVKVSDGGAAFCESKADAYRQKFGAYQSKVQSISVNNEMIAVKLELNFLQCKNVDGKFSFVDFKPYDEITYETVLMNGERKEISAQPELVKLISFKDGIYKKFADVTVINSATQTINLQIKLADVLTSEQIANLLNGMEVQGNFDYMIQKFIVIDNAKNADLLNFGAYRVHFKALIDENNQLIISLL